MKLTKLEIEIARGLYRQMPVKNCHYGRGRGHSESCLINCFDSWQRCVNEMAFVLTQNRKGFDREIFIQRANHL
jgi:hypothetical protein